MRRIITIVLVLVYSVFAFQTTTQSTNSFNKYLSPQNGVSLYSGTGNTTLPLSTGIPLTLSYSSNVTDNARSSNAIAPTGWLGLGWQMNFGSILSDHKGTKTTTDDAYVWISPQGVSSKLLRPHRIKYTYYESTASWSALPDFDNLVPVKIGYVDNFNINDNKKSENFGYVFETMIDLPYDGAYTFYLYSDDGSKLFMDGTTIVDNDGSHSVKWESGTTATTVKKGLHSLKIEYFQGPTGHDFNIHYSHAQIPRCQLPLEKLHCPGTEVDGMKKFYSEQNPYIKIEAIDKNEDEKIEGWVITNTDGSKMCYGNLDFSDTRDATRFTFCSGQYVGNVTSGVPELYPFQWDLSEIRDIIGNPVVYKYQQDLEAVHSGEYNSNALATPLFYTKASYLKEIKSPDGKKVTFTLEDKGDEKYDAYTFSSEPDGFLEFTESKRIKQIDSYNANATEPLVHYEFTYDYLNNTYSNLYKKSLLKSIKEYRSGTTVSDLYNTTILDYYDDIQRAERFDDSYNYGALKTILTNVGLLSKIEYSKVIGTDNSTLNYDYSLNGANECPLIHGSEGLVLHSGTYDEGKEFIVVQGGHKLDRLWLYTFDGNKWNYDNTFECQLYGNTGNKDVYVFDNTIVYKTSGHNQDVIKVLFWANEKWCVNDLTISGDGTGIDVVSVGNDFMVLRGGDGDDNKDRIWVYRRFNDCWVLDFKYNNYNFGIGGTKSIAAGKDYFVVKQDGASNNAWIVQWDGKKWNEHKIIYEGVSSKTFTDVYAGADYVVFIGSDGTESRRDHIWIYYWNGTSWRYDTEFKSYFLYNTEDKAVFVGNGFFVVQKAAGTQNQVWVFTWNGENWDKKQLEALSDPDWYHKVIVGPDYFILQGGSGSSNASIRLYKKTENEWVVEPMFNWTGINFDGNCVDIAIATTWNAFAVITTNNNILSNIYSRVYTFDGTTWNNAFENSYEKSGSKNPSLCVTRNGFGFATNANNNHLQFIHKFRNNYSNPESYVVTKTSNGSLPFSQETSTTYRYKNGVFDANYGIIKFNEVESINEQTGKIVNYYFNDSEADNQQQQNSEYKELDGFNYKKTVFRKAGIDTDDPPISKEEYSYQIEKKDHWPTNLKSKRLFETKSIVNSITKSSFLYYNESNGLPSEIVTRNPDGTATMIRTRFAFEYYNDMGINNKHMLSQPCQTITYGRLENQSYKPLASSAATFKQDPKTNCWLQDNNYRLNLAMDNNGFPEASGNYSYFNFGDVNQNSNWKFAGGNIKYDKYGSIIQTTSSDGINNSVIRRNDNKLTIAKIANAKYEECAVFTCDYDDRVDPEYFDKENGWAKAGSVLSSFFSHYNNKSVYVFNTYGPTKNVVFDPNVNHTFSANILPSPSRGTTRSTHYVKMAVEFHSGEFNGDATRIGSWGLNITDLKDGWNLYEHTIKKDELQSHMFSGKNAADIKFARIWIGNVPKSNTSDPEIADLYVEDIRFYPSAAHVTTTYYDATIGLPIQSVDANNKPGLKVTYDGFGRVVQWDKYVKGSDGSYALKTVKKQKYHLMKDWLSEEYFRVNTPKSGDVIEKNILGRLTNVEWQTNPSMSISQVKITIISDQHTWDIQSSTNNDGNFLWYDITLDKTYTNCKIRISDVNNPSHFVESEGYFTIKP